MYAGIVGGMPTAGIVTNTDLLSLSSCVFYNARIHPKLLDLVYFFLFDIQFSFFFFNPIFYTVGRFCEKRETPEATNTLESCGDVTDYQNTLNLECNPVGEPGTLVWKPDSNTPDIVFYQVK